MHRIQGVTPERTRRLLMTYSLGFAATIQLHKSFASRNANSNQKCLKAANSVVRIMDTADLSGVVFVNPIMGVSPSLAKISIILDVIF